MGDRYNIHSQLEHLQSKYIGTGHGDTTKWEWVTNQHRDSYASYLVSYRGTDNRFVSYPVMWKRKLEAEAPEAAIFHGSGSCKREMNGSGSLKKILEVEAETASFK